MLALALATMLSAGSSAEVPADPLQVAEPTALASALAQALLADDVDTLVKLTPPGFSFDGRTVAGEQEIRGEWTRALTRRSLAATQLYNVEVLTLEQMIKRFGKPPERLGKLTGDKIAVVNLGGRALVVLFKKHGAGWALAGVSD